MKASISSKVEARALALEVAVKTGLIIGCKINLDEVASLERAISAGLELPEKSENDSIKSLADARSLAAALLIGLYNSSNIKPAAEEISRLSSYIYSE